MKKTAIILFNLGGPDEPEAVQPFLFNLFNDKAIISAPNPIRWMLAKLISSKRAPIAQEIYKELGGGSPLLPLTQAQSAALDTSLNEDAKDQEYRSFICMRYWHPMTAQTVAEVKDYAPDEIILLPLYPQFSTTTSGSSFGAWHKEAKKQAVNIPTKTIGCYPMQSDFIAAHAAMIAAQWSDAPKGTRLLFSAHGLPEKIIKAGDPYQWQVEQTAAAVVKELEEAHTIKNIDWVVCYQSKVGPLAWITPSTEHEIARAGAESIPLMITPIAFVSEHSETLVELDIEYKELAEEKGVPNYMRVPALATHPSYITALKVLVHQAETQPEGSVTSHTGGRVCDAHWQQCPCRDMAM